MFRISLASGRMNVNRTRQRQFFKTCEGIVSEQSRVLRRSRDVGKAMPARYPARNCARIRREAILLILTGFSDGLHNLRRNRYDAYRNHVHSRRSLSWIAPKLWSTDFARLQPVELSASRDQTFLRRLFVFLRTLCIKILIPIRIRGAVLESRSPWNEQEIF